MGTQDEEPWWSNSGFRRTGVGLVVQGLVGALRERGMVCRSTSQRIRFLQLRVERSDELLMLPSEIFIEHLSSSILMWPMPRARKM